MNIGKTIGLLTLLAGACLLSGCDKNPLKTHGTRENVQALQLGAMAAEKALNLDAANRGRTYSQCMTNTPDAGVNCKDFFTRMHQALQALPGFDTARLNDLTDKDMFARLADDYEDKVFNTIDY